GAGGALGRVGGGAGGPPAPPRHHDGDFPDPAGGADERGAALRRPPCRRVSGCPGWAPASDGHGRRTRHIARPALGPRFSRDPRDAGACQDPGREAGSGAVARGRDAGLALAADGRGTEMKRVLVGDDHPVVRQGVPRLLQEGCEPATVGEAQDAAEALRLVREQEWDLVLLDISMPGGGLDALKQTRQEKPRLPVLVLSVHPEDQYAVRVLKAGAS